MRILLLLLTIALSGCATMSPKSSEWNWVRMWNFAFLPEEREEAARLMERHDYIRYTEQVARLTFDKNAGSTPVFDLEKEAVYFKLAVNYLSRLEGGEEKSREKLNVLARRLAELPNLHTMSKFLIARVQELNGGSYNKFFVPIPEGAAHWKFLVGGYDWSYPIVVLE